MNVNILKTHANTRSHCTHSMNLSLSLSVCVIHVWVLLLLCCVYIGSWLLYIKIRQVYVLCTLKSWISAVVYTFTLWSVKHCTLEPGTNVQLNDVTLFTYYARLIFNHGIYRHRSFQFNALKIERSKIIKCEFRIGRECDLFRVCVDDRLK